MLEAGKYCAYFMYLPGYSDYADVLPATHPLYNADRKIECINRCTDAYGYPQLGFHVKYNAGVLKCGCGTGDCTRRLENADATAMR